MNDTPHQFPEERWKQNWTDVTPPLEIPAGQLQSIPYGTIIQVEGGQWESHTGYFIAQPEGGVLRAAKLPEGWRPGEQILRQDQALSIQVHPEFGQKVFVISVASDNQIRESDRRYVESNADINSRVAQESEQRIQGRIKEVQDLLKLREPAPGSEYAI